MPPAAQFRLGDPDAFLDGLEDLERIETGNSGHNYLTENQMLAEAFENPYWHDDHALGSRSSADLDLIIPPSSTTLSGDNLGDPEPVLHSLEVLAILANMQGSTDELLHNLDQPLEASVRTVSDADAAEDHDLGSADAHGDSAGKHDNHALQQIFDLPMDATVHTTDLSNAPGNLFSRLAIAIEDSENEEPAPSQGGVCVAQNSDVGMEIQSEDDDDHRIDQVYDQLIEGSAPKRRRLRSKIREATGASGPGRFPAIKLKNLARSRGVSPRTFRALVRSGMPMLFLNMLFFVEQVFPVDYEKLNDVSELFSGVGNVHKGFVDAGLSGALFDEKRHSVHENILTPEGFMTSVRIIRNTRRGGCAHVATVCSTWIYLSRCSTGRSLSRPLGNRAKACVNEANTMLARVCLLLIFSGCMEVFWVHEQPATSLVPVTKFMLWVQEITKQVLFQQWRELFTWLGSFGHEVQKPTQLVTNAVWAQGLIRTLTAEERREKTPESLIDTLPHDPSTMRRRVTGCPDELKASQAYPVAYGQAVHAEWRKDLDRRGLAPEEEVDSDEEVPWEEWRQMHRQCLWKELELSAIADLFQLPVDVALL